MHKSLLTQTGLPKETYLFETQAIAYSFLNKVFNQSKESYTYLNNRNGPQHPTILGYPQNMSSKLRLNQRRGARARSKIHVVLKAKGCFQSKKLLGAKVLKITKFTIKFTY